MILRVFLLSIVAFSRVLLAEELPQPVRTVIILGVDGMSPRGVDSGYTPNMNRLIEQGSHSFHARAVLPTSSSPNWGSMISGASPAQHGITSNDWRLWNRSILPSQEGASKRFPTIFSELRKQRPDSKITVVYDWGGFKELFDHQQVDVNANTEGPERTMERAIEEFKYNRPDLLFIHLDHVDGAGHGQGWHTPSYFEAIQRADELVGDLIDAIDEEKAWGDTILILTSDHGGVGKSHGGESMDELEIPWIITGAGVANKREITRDINTFDTACTAAYALGINQHPSWIGKPIYEAFQTNTQSKGWRESQYIPAPQIIPPSSTIEADEIIVQINSEVPSATITYTLDGSLPTKYSTVYEQPFVLKESATIRARSFLRARQSDIVSNSIRLLTSDTPKPVHYEYFEPGSMESDRWEELPDFRSLIPIHSGMCPEVGLAMIDTREDQFAIRFTTQLQVDNAGTYMFHLKSDDGSRLHVGRRAIIDNDGSHGPIMKSGKIDLQAGLHLITVEYFEDHGGESLVLGLSGPDNTRLLLDHSNLIPLEND